jgi:hypothetical protein
VAPPRLSQAQASGQLEISPSMMVKTIHVNVHVDKEKQTVALDPSGLRSKVDLDAGIRQKLGCPWFEAKDRVRLPARGLGSEPECPPPPGIRLQVSTHCCRAPTRHSVSGGYLTAVSCAGAAASLRTARESAACTWGPPAALRT